MYPKKFHRSKKTELQVERLANPKTDLNKVEKILKGSLDLIPSPSSSVKTQIMGGKDWLSCKGKTLLGIVKKFVDITQQCFALLHLVNFSANNLKVKVMEFNPGYLLQIFSTVNLKDLWNKSVSYMTGKAMHNVKSDSTPRILTLICAD